LTNIVTVKSGLEVTQGHLNWYCSKAWVRSSIRLPQCFLSYHFLDTARYWPKIATFFIPTVFDAPVRRVRVRILPYRLVKWCGNPTVRNV